MNITLLTYGSRGDVQPFVALGLGLQAAGHTVRLAAPARFADFAAGRGIPFAALPGDPEELSRRLNNSSGRTLGTVKSLTDHAFAIAAGVIQAGLAACQDAGLIVHTFLFTTGAHSLARSLGIPDVSLQLFPVFAPTRAFPNVALPGVPPGLPSYFSHWLATRVFWHVGNRGYRRIRRANPGVPDLRLHWPFDQGERVAPRDRGESTGRDSPARQTRSVLSGATHPRTPLLFAYSPAVLPRPADWTDPHVHVTGYLFLDTPVSYSPPAELADFLAAGEPPVCVSFGSMVNREAARIDGIVREALKRTRQRGVILTGWGGAGTGAQDDTVLNLDAAPHDWLLPRCKAVVHHGGAGVTAAGLRAGVPNIVVPHAADQPFWGSRVAAIGAGPAPLALKHLTVEALADALAKADDTALRDRAEGIGRQIRAEDGVREAVRLIEAHGNAFIRDGIALSPRGA